MVLQEKNVKCHDETVRIRRKLERDDIEVIKDLGDERVKQEIDPHLQNHLAKGHVAARGMVRSLIPSSPAS